jgi:hypothetical protein
MEVARFPKEMITSGRSRELGVCMRRQRDDRNCHRARVRFQAPSCLASVHARHHQVHQDNRRMNACRDANGIDTVRGGVHQEATRRQEFRQHFAGVGLIVDNEHRGHARMFFRRSRHGRACHTQACFFCAVIGCTQSDSREVEQAVHDMEGFARRRRLTGRSIHGLTCG